MSAPSDSRIADSVTRSSASSAAGSSASALLENRSEPHGARCLPLRSGVGQAVVVPRIADAGGVQRVRLEVRLPVLVRKGGERAGIRCPLHPAMLPSPRPSGTISRCRLRDTHEPRRRIPVRGRPHGRRVSGCRAQRRPALVRPIAGATRTATLVGVSAYPTSSSARDSANTIPPIVPSSRTSGPPGVAGLDRGAQLEDVARHPRRRRRCPGRSPDSRPRRPRAARRAAPRPRTPGRRPACPGRDRGSRSGARDPRGRVPGGRRRRARGRTGRHPRQRCPHRSSRGWSSPRRRRARS